MATVAEIFKTMEYGPAPESDKEALAWLGKHKSTFGHYIDGAWTKAGKTFDFMPIIGTGHGAAETPFGSRLRMEFLVRHLQP